MRITKTLAAACLTVAATAITIAPATPAYAVSCPDLTANINDGRWGYFFAGNGINIRTGPSTVCVSIGAGYASYKVQLDCYKDGQNGTWSHLYVQDTAVVGWVKDTLLVGGGANARC